MADFDFDDLEKIEASKSSKDLEAMKAKKAVPSCSSCDGTGKLLDDECPVCDGSGKPHDSDDDEVEPEPQATRGRRGSEIVRVPDSNELHLKTEAVESSELEKAPVEEETEEAAKPAAKRMAHTRTAAFPDAGPAVAAEPAAEKPKRMAHTRTAAFAPPPEEPAVATPALEKAASKKMAHTRTATFAPPPEPAAIAEPAEDEKPKGRSMGHMRSAMLKTDLVENDVPNSSATQPELDQKQTDASCNVPLLVGGIVVAAAAIFAVKFLRR